MFFINICLVTKAGSSLASFHNGWTDFYVIKKENTVHSLSTCRDTRNLRIPRYFDCLFFFEKVIGVFRIKSFHIWNVWFFINMFFLIPYSFLSCHLFHGFHQYGISYFWSQNFRAILEIDIQLQPYAIVRLLKKLNPKNPASLFFGIFLYEV